MPNTANRKSTLFYIKAILLSAIVGIITLKDTDCLIAPGVDMSYRWALNYFLAYKSQLLATLSYPVGPLCIIKWAAPVGDHLLISVLAQWILQVLFCLQSIYLYTQRSKSELIFQPIIISLVALLLFNLDYVILGNVLLGLLIHHHLAQPKALIVAVTVTIIALLFKSSVFLFCASVWVMWLAHSLYSKQYKLIAVVALGALSGYAIIAGIIFSGIGGAYSYLCNNILPSLSYSHTLALYPYNSATALAITISLLLVLGVAFAKKESGYLLLLASLCGFVNWKYAMGREDFYHALYFLNFIVLLLALFLLVEQQKKELGTYILVGAISFYSYNLSFLNSDPRILWYPTWLHFNQRIVHHKEFKQHVSEQSVAACQPNVLAAEWLQQIGNKRIDIFPWDLSYAYINKLTLAPRPGLQSPALNRAVEAMDIAYLKSGKAPGYYIWHHPQLSGNGMEGLNGEYLPNSSPLFTEAIMQHYEPTAMANDRLCVLRKRSQPLRLNKQVGATLRCTAGIWVSIPQHDSSTQVAAQIVTNSTLLEKCTAFLYKPNPLYIEYRKTDSSIIRYKLSTAAAERQVYLSPLYKDVLFHRDTMVAFRLVTETAEVARQYSLRFITISKQ